MAQRSTLFLTNSIATYQVIVHVYKLRMHKIHVIYLQSKVLHSLDIV